MSKIPVVIDCDPGVDDIVAILLANSNNSIEIKALTAVNGNQTHEKVSKNALDIAGFLNLDTRVAKGADKPLIALVVNAGYIHGESGLGDVVLPENSGSFDEKKAWDVIYEEAVAADGELVIFALGPLTNIALAVLKYPELKDMIKHIYSMGGSTMTGNITPFAEFNYYADPHAVEVVFRSGCEITMAGLNATHQAKSTLGDLKKIASEDSSIKLVFEGLLSHFTKFMGQQSDSFEMVMHDAVTVALLFDPSMYEAEKHYVQCELHSEMSFGQTIVDFYKKLDGKPNVNVVTKVDAEKFNKQLFDMVDFYKKDRG